MCLEHLVLTTGIFYFFKYSEFSVLVGMKTESNQMLKSKSVHRSADTVCSLLPTGHQQHQPAGGDGSTDILKFSPALPVLPSLNTERWQN